MTVMLKPIGLANFFGRGYPPQYLAVILFGSLSSGLAQTLYDAGLGTLPEVQGWAYGAFGSGITKNVAGDSVLLDTSAQAGNQAGWSRLAIPPLDRSQGFTLLFTVQLNAEAHINTNRAGFSVIVLGSDTNGIELAFWANTIFAQEGPPRLFVHAEDVAIATTGGFVDYALTMAGSNYVLRANGEPILSGPVRDYSSFSGLINPYRQPNFLFFGDNTTSAGGSVNVSRFVLVRPPLLETPTPGVVSWLGISNLSYRVQASSNLVTWADLGVATSPADTFSYTNSATGMHEFFRVAHP